MCVLVFSFVGYCRLITAFPLSSLLFVGVMLLGLSALLFVCLLSNMSNQFRIFLNWSVRNYWYMLYLYFRGEQESKDYQDVCRKVGWSHLHLKSFVKYIISLREKEPKKVSLYLTIIIKSSSLVLWIWSLVFHHFVKFGYICINSSPSSYNW